MSRSAKPLSALGQRIRARRHGLGLSQRDVAAASKGSISCPYLCQIETGKVVDPGLIVCIDLARILSVSIEQLAAWRREPWQDLPRCDHCGQIIEDGQ